MIGAIKKGGVYAYSLVLFVCTQSTALFAKSEGSKESSTAARTAASTTIPTSFEWKEHRKLSWDDFRGPCGKPTDETVAVTHCGMGFKTSATATASEKPEIIVFNRFYTNKSWVMSDAKLPEILEHEQGHFDLCEIYTRRLKAALDAVDFAKPGAREELYAAYERVNAEYEARQQQYEDETTHGTIDREQKRWTANITRELTDGTVMNYE